MDFDALIARMRAAGHAVVPLEVLDAVAHRAGYSPDPEEPGLYRDADGFTFEAWPAPAPVHHRPRRRRSRAVAFRDLI